MCNIILSLFFQTIKKMPKETMKLGGKEGDNIPLHGATNEEETKEYSKSLDIIVIKMDIDVKGELCDAMKKAILDYKEAIVNMIPSMETADPDAVWRSMKDKVGLCICPLSEESEKTLECLILDQEVPQAAKVLEKIEEDSELMQEERDLIRELFDSLETAHSDLALACSVLSCLSGTLQPRQLMTILEASTRPLIQIKTTSAFKPPDVPGKMSELPDDQEERVELLMMPNSAAKPIKDKKVNSPTRLLAATWAYRYQQHFWQRHHTMENPGVIQHACQTTGGLHNEEEISGGSRQEKKTIQDR